MHALVEQGDLATALQAVGRAVATRSPMPLLTGVHVAAGDGHVTLTATDLELAIRARVPARVETPGEAVLPARYLTEYVRRVPLGPIELRAEPGGTGVTLRWERSEYVLHGYPPADFPVLALGTGDRALTVDAGLLRRALRHTVFAVSADDAKPALTGVYLRLDGDGLLAIGCDGFRVAMLRLPGAGTGERVEAVVPGRAVQELVRLLPDEGAVRLELREQQLHAEAGDLQVATRLIDAPYPDVPRLLPQAYPHRLWISREALLEATERIAPLADARHTTRWLVVLEAGPGRLVLETQDPEIGRAREELPVEYEGEPLRIGVNVRYLLDALRHTEGETLELGLIGPTQPIRVQAREAPEAEHVIYPIRL